MTRENISSFQRLSKVDSEPEDGIDPNLPDRNGVTPLMHAATLGHPEVVKVMMEHNRSGSVNVDLQARDMSGRTALDHVDNQTNNRNIDSNKNSQPTTTSRHAEVKEILTAYSQDAGAIRCPSPNPQSEGIELVDMRNLNDNKSRNMRYQNTIIGTPENEQTANDNDKLNEDSDNSIRRWAADLKQQHDDAGRMSSLRSASGSSLVRPGSRQGSAKSFPLKERPMSASLTVPPRSPRPPSARGKSLRLGSKNDHSGNAVEDDDDFSLESLSELLGTVRQYAKEIHEIYAPIQKDEEERIRKRNERNARKKSKELSKNAVRQPSKHLVPPHQHEVRVEIHKLEDQVKESIQGKSKNRSRHEMAHSKSHEPSSAQPVASLHVENEQLSSTWPRGRHRSASRERFWSDTTSDKPKFNTMHSFPSSSSFSRPQIPTDWSDAGTIQHEREILNKAFQRIHKPGVDPLLGAFNKNQGKSGLQKDVISSRQSIIQIAKQHQEGRQADGQKQADVPSISVIPPPMDHGNQLWGVSSGALPSVSPISAIPFATTTSPTGDNDSYDIIIPEAPIVSSDHVTRTENPRQSKNGGAGVKSSTKAGLRRRTSVDKGLGQHNVPLEKY